MGVVRRARRDPDEEPEDERPTRRRPRDDDDEEPERPRRKARRDDDEEDEEERPPKRRSRSRDDDEDEDEPPRRRRASRDEEDEDEEPPKRRSRSRDDEDEDEPPKRRRKASRDDEDEEDEEGNLETRRPKSSSVRKGWKGYKETRAQSTDFAEELRVTDDPDLVKFLEDEPFAVYRQHWIDHPVGTKKKSWTCLAKTKDDKCPLCDIGDRPRALSAFNVLHLNTGGDPENKILVLGNKAAGQVENYANDDKTGPLTKMYYAISRSGKGQSSAWNFQRVKDRDLEEDWGIEPLTKAEIREALEQVYDESTIYIPSYRDMKMQADAAVDEDD